MRQVQESGIRSQESGIRNHESEARDQIEAQMTDFVSPAGIFGLLTSDF